MKLYTSESQTVKLILIGMPKPHGTTEHQELVNKGWITVSETHGDYTIGQLLSFLPASASQRIRYVATKRAWIVDVDVLGKDGKCYRGVYYAEFIDALYDMVIKLKEEGVI
jgi:hypothetical protein